MSSEIINGVFECPRGFSKEDIATSQLYFEEIDKNSELWLVRLPSHVDPKTLEDQEIDVNNVLNVLSDGDNQYECISERCRMPNLCLVLPEKDTNQLRGVKKMFQGNILLYDSVMEEEVVQVKAEENVDNFVKPKPKKNGHEVEPSAMQFESEESEAGPSRKSHKKKKSKVKLEPSSDME